MTKTGIEKRLDNLGRILIPKDIRKKLGFELNAPLEMIITDEGVLIRKPKEKSE